MSEKEFGNENLDNISINDLKNAELSKAGITVAGRMIRASQMPEVESMGYVWGHMPPEKAILIEGVLKRGDKCIVIGPSKAGKSYLLIALTICIAAGMEWLGIPVHRGKVLYVNFELNKSDCFGRIKEVAKAMQLSNKRNFRNNIDVMNLRGSCLTVDEVIASILFRAQEKDYSAIIIDPVYKLLQGDENSNQVVTEMLLKFDLLAEMTGASIIFAHHFAKGSGSDKASIDRGSGAGAFARDPDAIITTTQLDIEDTERTAWRLEYTLRAFPQKEPTCVYFDYPLHTVDHSLDAMSLKTSASIKNQEKLKQNQRETEQEKQLIEKAFELCATDAPTVTDLFQKYKEVNGSKSEYTLRSNLKKFGYEELQRSGNKGSLWKRKQ